MIPKPRHIHLLSLLSLLGSFIFTAHAAPAPSPISPKLFSSNVESKIKEQLVSDLTLAHQLKFTKTSALHQKLFGTKPNGYLAWFNKRISLIAVGRCAWADAAVACVIPILESDMMRITQKYLEMNAPQVARMSVLFHEARHTEPNPILKAGDPDLRYWMHAKCPAVFVDQNNQERKSIWTGLPLSGADGCDITPVGSYGTVVIMLKNISNYATSETANEKVKADAELYANDQLTRIIDAKAHEDLVKDLSINQ